MNIYDGGSTNDDQLISMTGNYASSQITSSGSQLFIEFSTNGNGVGKGFSVSILFGNYINQIYLPILQESINSDLISILL